MNISRVFNSERAAHPGYGLALALIVLVSACTAQPGPTAPVAAPDALPTFGAQTASAPREASTAPALSGLTATPAPTEEIWLEQPFGPDGLLAVLFYADSTRGQSCLRSLVSLPGATPVSACADPAGAALVAVQGWETDSAGERYTIIVGRVFQPTTRVVVVEMHDGENFSVNVDGSGIILILPGERRAFQAVPIDEFGNLTGEIYRFS